MNRKLTFIICLLTVFGMKLSAQDIQNYGFYLGGSVNWMNIDKSLYYDDSEPFTRLNPSDTTIMSAYYLPVKDGVVKPNTGFVFGGFYEYFFSDMIGLQVDLLINQYGYKLSGEVTQRNLLSNDSTTYSYKSNLKTTNIGAAVLLKIHPADFISIDLGVHPTFCFRIIKDAERGVNHKSYEYKIKDEYNPLSVSAVLGTTAYLGDFFFSLRYTLGFTNLLKYKKPYVSYSNEYESSIKYIYSDAKSTASSVMLTVGFRIRN